MDMGVGGWRGGSCVVLYNFHVREERRDVSRLSAMSSRGVNYRDDRQTIGLSGKTYTNRMHAMVDLTVGAGNKKKVGLLKRLLLWVFLCNRLAPD